MRVFIELAYDGTNYHGWQRQPEAITVQQAIEDALEKLCGEKCPIIGCGRTDSGVHAKGQVAHFDIDEKNIDIKKLHKSINYILSKNKNRITILKSSFEKNNFHSRFSVRKKNMFIKYLIDQQILICTKKKYGLFQQN